MPKETVLKERKKHDKNEICIFRLFGQTELLEPKHSKKIKGMNANFDSIANDLEQENAIL